MALQTIRSRNMPPLESGVVSVGIIRGGERFNIIPEQVHLEGNEILAGITAAGGGSYDLEYERVTPATINDMTLTERVVPTMQAVVGSENVIRTDPVMGGEDFAYFSNAVLGLARQRRLRISWVWPGPIAVARSPLPRSPARGEGPREMRP